MAAATCVRLGGVRADGVSPDVVVRDFSFITPFTDSGPNALPAISGSWAIPRYGGLLEELTCVKLELTTTLRYDGTLISELSSVPYELRVRSDFTVDFGGVQPGNVTALDPVVILTGVTDPVPNTQFAAGANLPVVVPASQTTTLTLPGDLMTYHGAGDVAVVVNGFLVTDPLAGFHNQSDQGTASPAAFLNQPKVFPIFGLQLYQLETTLRVTYFVPEAGSSAITLLGLPAAWFLWRRKRSGTAGRGTGGTATRE